MWHPLASLAQSARLPFNCQWNTGIMFPFGHIPCCRFSLSASHSANRQKLVHEVPVVKPQQFGSLKVLMLAWKVWRKIDGGLRVNRRGKIKTQRFVYIHIWIQSLERQYISPRPLQRLSRLVAAGPLKATVTLMSLTLLLYVMTVSGNMLIRDRYN